MAASGSCGHKPESFPGAFEYGALVENGPDFNGAAVIKAWAGPGDGQSLIETLRSNQEVAADRLFGFGEGPVRNIAAARAGDQLSFPAELGRT